MNLKNEKLNWVRISMQFKRPFLILNLANESNIFSENVLTNNWQIGWFDKFDSSCSFVHKRKVKKKNEIPDYRILAEYYMPDYDFDNLYDEGIEP